MTISVICCYNNAEQYQNLCESLAQQNAAYEMVGVNNENNAFSSAAAALNFGAEKATGEYLVFTHQDIVFLQGDSLSRLVTAVENLGSAIVGVAGASHKKRMSITMDLMAAETLDECCVAMPRQVWQRYPFNETVCNGWHLYTVELCLRADPEIQIAAGDFGIAHLSSGNVDQAYMETFRKLIGIYKEKGWIATTCKSLPTNLPVFYVYYAMWKMKKMLLGNYPLMHSLKNRKRLSL